MNQSLKCAVIVAVVALANVSRAAGIQITDDWVTAGGVGTGTEFQPIDNDGAASHVDLPYPRGDGSTLGGFLPEALEGIDLPLGPTAASGAEAAGAFSPDGKTFRGLNAPFSAASLSDDAADLSFGAGGSSVAAPDVGDSTDFFGGLDAPSSPAASVPFGAADLGSPFKAPETPAADDKRFPSLATDATDYDAFAGVATNGEFDTQALNYGTSAFGATGGFDRETDADEIAKVDAAEFAKVDAAEFAKVDADDFAKVDATEFDAFDTLAQNDDLTFGAGSHGHNHLLDGLSEDRTGTNDFEGPGSETNDLSDFALGNLPSAASATPDDSSFFSDSLQSADAFASGGAQASAGLGDGFEGLNSGFDSAAPPSSARPAFTKRGFYAAAGEIGSDIRQATGDITDEIKDGVETVGDDVRRAVREVRYDVRQATGDVADEFRDGVSTVKGDIRAHYGRNPYHRYQKRGFWDKAMSFGGRFGNEAKQGWTAATQRFGYGAKTPSTGVANAAKTPSTGVANAAKTPSTRVTNAVKHVRARAGWLSAKVRNSPLLVKPVTHNKLEVVNSGGEVIKKARKAPLVAAGFGLGAGTVYVGSKFANDDSVRRARAENAEDDEQSHTHGSSEQQGATSALSNSGAGIDAASTTKPPQFV